MSGNASETAQFDIIVNDGQAKRALGETRTSAQQLGGGLSSVVEGLDKLGGKSGKDASNALRSLSFAMGSLGGTAGEVLNVAGDLADLIGGGPYALAFAGAAAAATAGAFAFNKIRDALHDAKEGAAAFDRAIAGVTTSIDAASKGRLDALTTKLHDLGVGLKNVGKDSDDIEIRTQKERIVQLNKDLERVGGLAFKNATNPNIDRNTQGALASILEKQRETLLAEANKSVKILDDFIREVGQKRDKSLEETDAEKRAGALDLKVKRILKGAAVRAGDSEEDKLFKQLDKDAEDKVVAQMDEISAARQTNRELNLERERLYKDAVGKIHADIIENQIRLVELGAAEEEAIRQKRVAEVQGYATTALSIGTSASQQLLDAIIAGQDHATEHFIASTFKQTGTALIGYGTQTAAAGIAAGAAAAIPVAAIPGAALAAFAGASALGLAQGGALIAGGFALGGVGAGIEASIAGVGSSGGSGGGFQLDPGVGSRSSSDSSSRGDPQPVTVVFQYGLGPAPEKMARDLAQAVSFAQGRGILKPGFNRSSR